ncbi:MAG: hypothetical protein PHT51_04640 [Patescibacteria group bacterium]|nr:hypothetical protein [Patescibacteria group bacterium]
MTRKKTENPRKFAHTATNPSSIVRRLALGKRVKNNVDAETLSSGQAAKLAGVPKGEGHEKARKTKRWQKEKTQNPTGHKIQKPLG